MKDIEVTRRHELKIVECGLGEIEGKVESLVG
jgi:hypothetical protein